MMKMKLYFRHLDNKRTFVEGGEMFVRVSESPADRAEGKGSGQRSAKGGVGSRAGMFEERVQRWP